jgi:hypothetical protein
MNIRKNLFWHPVHGELAKLSGDEYSYENKDTIANEAPLYIDQPMETVYERDRRLWVEKTISRDIINQEGFISIGDMVQYYCSIYDEIQQKITEFVNATNQNQ